MGYQPLCFTLAIIEAAKTPYKSHSVENIARHETDNVSTDTTIKYILDVIQKSKANGEKSICCVAGVPGAGKTLVGLDVSNYEFCPADEEILKKIKSL